MQESVLTAVFLPIALGIIMLGLGLSLRLSDFGRVAKHPKAVIIALAAAIERAKSAGGVDASVNATNSAVFFLLGLYALLTTTHQWPARGALIEDYLRGTLRSMLSRLP